MASYGYARVSTTDQNPDRQLDAFRGEGIEENNIFCDKASGKDFEREEYKRLVGSAESPPILREGDVLIVPSIDRLGRNYGEIQSEWRRITQEIKADVKVLDMPLLDTTSADGTLDRRFIADITLQILSYVAAKERENIRKRQAQGIQAAKERGAYTVHRNGGRGRKPVDAAQFERIYQSYKQGKLSAKDAMAELGLKHTAFFKRVKERDEAGKAYNPNERLITSEAAR